MGLKLHEDWGTTPAAIDNCLAVAEEYDVQVGKTLLSESNRTLHTVLLNLFHFQQVNIHTDTLNESGFVEHTIASFKGRTIHTYHRYQLYLL